MSDRISIQRHTDIFCVTPKESFSTSDSDIKFVHDKYYFAFGVYLNNGNCEKDKVLIFNDEFKYVLYDTTIAKGYFEYIENYPIKKAHSELLLDKLYQIIKIRF